MLSPELYDGVFKREPECRFGQAFYGSEATAQFVHLVLSTAFIFPEPAWYIAEVRAELREFVSDVLAEPVDVSLDALNAAIELDQLLEEVRYLFCEALCRVEEAHVLR